MGLFDSVSFACVEPRRRASIIAALRCIPTVLLGVTLGAAIWVGHIASAAADEPSKVFRVGVLMIPNNSPLKDGIQEGLRELGYVEGKNIVFDWRMTAPEYTDKELRSVAVDLAGTKPDLIIVGSTPAARAVLDETTVPLVFLVGDPIAAGLATSLARPGGRATGLSILAIELAGKRLELLRSLVPKAQRIVFMLNTANPTNTWQLREIQTAARALGIQLTPLDVKAAGGLDAALNQLPRSKANGAVIAAEVVFLANRARIAQALRSAKLPAIFPSPAFHDAGVLMSYGPNLSHAGRALATYVDRILKGANPAELPIEQVSKFELTLDLREARRLGIKVPQILLQRADTVIR